MDATFKQITHSSCKHTYFQFSKKFKFTFTIIYMWGHIWYLDLGSGWDGVSWYRLHDPHPHPQSCRGGLSWHILVSLCTKFFTCNFSSLNTIFYLIQRWYVVLVTKQLIARFRSHTKIFKSTCHVLSTCCTRHTFTCANFPIRTRKILFGLYFGYEIVMHCYNLPRQNIPRVLLASDMYSSEVVKLIFYYPVRHAEMTRGKFWRDIMLLLQR